MKRLLILGQNGMLGRMATLRLGAAGYHIHNPVTARYAAENERAFVEEVYDASRHVDAVINCIGAIPQKNPTPQMMLAVNADLPIAIARAIAPMLFIHPSTDCVFEGNRGHYRAEEKPDATSLYGQSKATADTGLTGLQNALILRTSIVGPWGERGLLDWLLSQPLGAKIQGWTNHLWNGVTTMDWCDVVDEILCSHDGARGIHHIASAGALSKYALLLAMQAAYGQGGIVVEPTRSPTTVNRTLWPNRGIGWCFRGSIFSQLKRMADWDKRSQR